MATSSRKPRATSVLVPPVTNGAPPVFAVYAPFGTDPVLSVWPFGKQPPIEQQALVLALNQVAELGVNVCALIDLYDDYSWLVSIPAGKPAKPSFCRVGKQDMSSPFALADFLVQVQRIYPRGMLALALEGHGAGFLPDIDPLRLTPASTTNNGQIRWNFSNGGASYEKDPASEALPVPSPELPVPSPELPVPSPELPASRLPLSTWGVGEALRLAAEQKVRRPAVIHFNNCFNMAVEHLHTVAPYADYATGYCNYNFYTAGAAYPLVWAKPGANAEELARNFALRNRAALASQRNHPTIGASIALARMAEVAKAVDALGTALLGQLMPLNRPDRVANRELMRGAIVNTLQYDSDGDFNLETPDQMTDLGQLANELARAFPGSPVANASSAVLSALRGVKVYGDVERPYKRTKSIWDFSHPALAMSIFLPDPLLQGQWDWRSPYYLAGKVIDAAGRSDPLQPPAHRRQIPFLTNRAGGKRPPWVEFIIEYHRGVKFLGLRRAVLPPTPGFEPKFQTDYPPICDHGDDQPPRGTPKR